MQRMLASPRRRRRLAWAAVGAVALAAAAVTVVMLPEAKPPPENFRPGSTIREEREVPLTAVTRRDINETLDRFVPAAVGRRDPALAWELAGPGLRAGTKRREWLAGDLPVVPFPFREQPFHGWRVIYTYRDRVGLDLLLHPRADARVGAVAYAIDVVRKGRRWLVDSFYPVAMWSAPDERPFVTGPADFTSEGTTAKAYYQSRTVPQATLGPAWFAVPLALVGAAVLGLVGIWLASIHRNRRAQAAHAAFRSSATSTRVR